MYYLSDRYHYLMYFMSEFMANKYRLVSHKTHILFTREQEITALRYGMLFIVNFMCNFKRQPGFYGWKYIMNLLIVNVYLFNIYSLSVMPLCILYFIG